MHYLDHRAVEQWIITTRLSVPPLLMASQSLFLVFLLALMTELQSYQFIFDDKKIEDMNITDVSREWIESREMVKDIYRSSFESVLQAIRKEKSMITIGFVDLDVFSVKFN